MVLSGMLLTILPDIDVLAFRFGIPYEHMFGHRGFTHSIFFAALISGMVAWLHAWRGRMKFSITWLYLFVCMASHGLLDALTNGGLGIAFFAPFSNERYFLPIQPIKVSTLNISYFFTNHGVLVLQSELINVWGPCLLLFISSYLLYRFTRR